MFNEKQLREQIVRVVLKGLGMWSKYAEELMIGTIAVESQGGTYLVQLDNGPAVGICQMEPKTHDDIWQKWLPNHPAISANLMTTCMISMKPSARMMISNLFYAVAMARIQYFRNTPEPVPATLEEQAAYWVKYYNRGERATVAQYLEAYRNFVKPGVINGNQQPSKPRAKAKS